MNSSEESILTEQIESYVDVQTHIWNVERRKTRNKIWIIGAAFLISSLIGLGSADMMTTENILGSLLVPGICLALGFLALANAMAAVIAVTLIFLAIFGYQFYLVGAYSLLSGILLKGVLVFLLISSWMSARQAMAAKQQLGEIRQAKT